MVTTRTIQLPELMLLKKGAQQPFSQMTNSPKMALGQQQMSRM
jgi:hypothetical protein